MPSEVLKTEIKDFVKTRLAAHEYPRVDGIHRRTTDDRHGQDQARRAQGQGSCEQRDLIHSIPASLDCRSKFAFLESRRVCKQEWEKEPGGHHFGQCARTGVALTADA